MIKIEFFPPDDFENFVHARFGHGDPIYMYAVGDALTFPDGAPMMRNEGCDMGRLYSFDKEKGEAVALTRKLIVMRNTADGEIIRGPDGQPVWMPDFTYQLFTFRLENGSVSFEAEQGGGDTFFKCDSVANTMDIQKFNAVIFGNYPIDLHGYIWKVTSLKNQ